MRITNCIHLRNMELAVAPGHGHCLIALVMPDQIQTVIGLLAQKNIYRLSIFNESSLHSARLRNAMVDYSKIYSFPKRTGMANAKFSEVANYEDIAIGYVEWEGQDQSAPEYFNDYYTIGIEDGVVRMGSVFYKDGVAMYQLVKRKAVKCASIQEAHNAIIEHINTKIVSDALGA